MVPKLMSGTRKPLRSFRAVLFRMVPKLPNLAFTFFCCFRAVLFRMVPKLRFFLDLVAEVLELCCFEWFQNPDGRTATDMEVLELCCFEWFQPTLKATHFLSSFFLIQVYILVVTTPFPCREVRLQVLRITLPLLTSGWYYTSVFLLELER